MGQLVAKYRMPLDSNFGANLFYSRCIGWELKFAWLPHRCELSGRLIWLELAYRGTAVHHFDITFIQEYRWHTTIEHIVWELKK
jgi:hypothetical protein